MCKHKPCSLRRFALPPSRVFRGIECHVERLAKRHCQLFQLRIGAGLIAILEHVDSGLREHEVVGEFV